MRLRCDQAIRELADSNDDGFAGVAANPALAAHLASCPDCSAWAEDGARLLRDWHATRPAEPPAEVWDALWARVRDRLDAATARRAVIAMPERPAGRFRPALVVLGLAQAAAVLAAVLLLPGRQPHQERENLARAQPVQNAGFDIPPGELAILHCEKDGTWRMELREGDNGPGLGDNLALFNDVESMADTE
jgi:hypothetical protein